MNKLRMTNPARGLALVVCAALTGCSAGEQRSAAPPPEPSERAVCGPKLPPPESDRIEYNADTRTLTFYDPPRTTRWMIQRPGERFPVPAGPDHRLPAGVDPDNTLVYFSRPGGRVSIPVSLRQIQDAREMHASTIR